MAVLPWERKVWNTFSRAALSKEGHFLIFAIGNRWIIKHPEGPHILFVSN